MKLDDSIPSDEEQMNTAAMTRRWKTSRRECVDEDVKLSFDHNLIFTIYICSLNQDRVYPDDDLENK